MFGVAFHASCSRPAWPHAAWHQAAFSLRNWLWRAHVQAPCVGLRACHLSPKRDAHVHLFAAKHGGTCPRRNDTVTPPQATTQRMHSTSTTAFAGTRKRSFDACCASSSRPDCVDSAGLNAATAQWRDWGAGKRACAAASPAAAPCGARVAIAAEGWGWRQSGGGVFSAVKGATRQLPNGERAQRARAWGALRGDSATFQRSEPPGDIPVPLCLMHGDITCAYRRVARDCREA